MCSSELTALPEGVRRVAAVLQQHGHPHGPQMLDSAARTAQQAANVLGVELGQIAKSIVFRRRSDGAAVLVITSGDRRVDEAKVAALVGAIGRADADFVKAQTGYSIGGVSPVGHSLPPVTLIDRELLRFDELWAAAGHPHAVFKLCAQDLQRWTGAATADVVQAIKVARGGSNVIALAQNRPAAVPVAPGSPDAVEVLRQRHPNDAMQAKNEALQTREAHAVAIKNVAARARSICSNSTNDADSVPSPCISLCRVDARTTWCDGCLRTLDEISQWSRLDAAGKRRVWQTIGRRAEQVGAALAAGTL